MSLSRIPWRLILSVLAGIVISKALAVLVHFILHKAGILGAVDDPEFHKDKLTIALVIHSIFAIVGAFITAMIAREQARKAVFILGSKEAIMWILGLVLLWHHSPPWFNLSKAILGPPLAWFGGWLYHAWKVKRVPDISKP